MSLTRWGRGLGQLLLVTTHCKVLSLQGADGGGSSAANGPGVAPTAPAGGSRSSSRNLGSSGGEKEEGKKVRRQWESWSTEDKNTFFEGLYEVSFLEPAGPVGLPPHIPLGGPRPCPLTLALHLLGVTFKAVSSEVAVRKCLCFSLLRCSPVAQSGVHPSGPSPCSWWQFCGRGGTSRATLSCSGSPAIASFKTENEYSFFRIFTF